MNANQPLRVVLEISKIEKELLIQAIQESRKQLRMGNLPESQKSRRIRMLLALETHVEDSWQNEVSTWKEVV